MTKGSVVLTRLAVGSIAVGALAIVVGNLQIAMGDSYRLRVIGETRASHLARARVRRPTAASV